MFCIEDVAEDAAEGHPGRQGQPRGKEPRSSQAQRMEALGQLAAGVAHDFNNLLTVICSNSDHALKQLPVDHALYERIAAVRDAGDRAAALTRQLLTFARCKNPAPMAINLNWVVRDLHKMLTRLIGEHIELTLRLDPHIGRIKADPTQLSQLLMNLVLNARDAMPQGGSLTLRTYIREDEPGGADADLNRGENGTKRKPKRWIVLVVSDTGAGMTPVVLGRIFERFFTTKSPGRGTGLGLPIVHEIVRKCGGRIDVVSSPNAGSTFSISFPEATDAPEQPRRQRRRRCEK